MTGLKTESTWFLIVFFLKESSSHLNLAVIEISYFLPLYSDNQAQKV